MCLRVLYFLQCHITVQLHRYRIETKRIAKIKKIYGESNVVDIWFTHASCEVMDTNTIYRAYPVAVIQT